MTNEKKEIAELELRARNLPVGLCEYLCNGVNGVSVDRLITTIADIEDIGFLLNAQMDYLIAARNELINRAKTSGIKADNGAILIETTSGKNKRNLINTAEKIEEFSLRFEDSYIEIRAKQKEKLKQNYTKAVSNIDGTEIPLLLADDVIGKDRVTAFTGMQPKEITYKVERKRG
jgi:hypothetical protein